MFDQGNGIDIHVKIEGGFAREDDFVIPKFPVPDLCLRERGFPTFAVREVRAAQNLRRTPVSRCRREIDRVKILENNIDRLPPDILEGDIKGQDRSIAVFQKLKPRDNEPVAAKAPPIGAISRGMPVPRSGTYSAGR